MQVLCMSFHFFCVGGKIYVFSEILGRLDQKVIFNRSVLFQHRLHIVNIINQKKCKIMKFGRDNLNEKFSFGNNVFAEVSDFRYLGIQMDNRLKFECHINNVCGKLAKFNGLLLKGRNYFSKNVLVKFYNCKATHFLRFHCIWCNIKKPIRKNICDAKTYF